MKTATSHSTLSQQIVDAVRVVVGPGRVALHEPRFAGNEWLYLKECLDSTFVSSVGKFVDRFEDELAAFTGARHAIAVSNGTAALHVALRLAGVREGDEVLMPALSFVATAAAIRYCGATPHFVDSDERTLGIDPAALRSHLQQRTAVQGGQCVNLETGRPIKALVPMHTFGHPVDVDGHSRRRAGLQPASGRGRCRVARQYRSTAATPARSESPERSASTATRRSRPAAAAPSSRTIPTLARRAKHLTTTAKVPHRWDFVHDDVGYNYRMPNINAALGCAQLEQLPTLARREAAPVRSIRGGVRRRAARPHLRASRRVAAATTGCRPWCWTRRSRAERDAILARPPTTRA